MRAESVGRIGWQFGAREPSVIIRVSMDHARWRRIEKLYNAALELDPGERGLGAESLYIGLKALDRFAWIGAFSTAPLLKDFDATFPDLASQANLQLRLLWMACGTEDALITSNRMLRGWLASKGIRHIDIEIPGGHTMRVWRRNLAAFAPLLFQPAHAK